jgi:hypothetical protein
VEDEDNEEDDESVSSNETGDETMILGEADP